MAQCEMLSDCKEKFKDIDKRLEKGDDEFKAHGEKIVKVETNVDNLTRSLRGVTAALWGVASAIGLSVLGLLVFFIETNIK